MAAESQDFRAKLIDQYFRTQSSPAPAHLWVTLTTVLPTVTDTGATITEPSAGAGYARQSYDPSAGNWSTQTGSDGTTKILNAIVWPAATGAGWGTVVGVAIVDSGTLGAGNVLFYGALVSSKTIGTGDIAEFAAGNLSVQWDN